MNIDNEIFDLIQEEYDRQMNGLELIASENFTSKYVMKAMGNVMTNKYAEGYPGKRYYGGCEVVDKSEQLAIDRAKNIFNVAFANVQPHSGAQANAAVMLAILKPGDTILGLDLSMGGHLTHGSLVNFSGKLYNPIFYGVKKEDGLVDYDMMEKQATTHKPKLIICGASAYSRDWDYKKIRAIADSINAYVLCDMSHPAGLIAKGHINAPFDYCHFVTSTTHKTLRGPRGGIILMKNDFENKENIYDNKGNLKMMSDLINLAVFPGTQGGPLQHVIAAKAVAFYEIMQPEFLTYTSQVIKNAKALEKAFHERDYHIVSGGTDNHLLLIDLRNKNVTGKKAENTLVKADITLNKNMVPYDDKSPFITSGIRIGSPAITTRGLTETHMEWIVSCIDRVICNIDDEKTIQLVRSEIHDTMRQFPLYDNWSVL